MSFVTAHPGALATAASQLNGVGSVMAARNVAATAATTGLLPVAADEVSALTATQFNAQGVVYQAVSAQANVVHELFVAILGTSAGSYAATEAANAIAAR